ncbi:DUF3139 domain-containing protein [Paucisalibacillus sp. EB02]|uniref:YfjL-like protein n=1 Tax=Paucisalibacillus sp. EB02 TaxID=1347087 RepID=UPI0005A71E67|nr:DUF3139 domain-containing protein [Paucisalibacillus sp. EB02]
MRKKKWWYILLIIVITLPVLIISNAFNGNPLSKQIAKITLNKYLEEEYPEDKFHVEKPFFNFKDSGYNFEVKKIGDTTQESYDFTVTGILGTKVSYDSIYYANLDQVLIRKLQQEANSELGMLMKSDIPELIEVDVMVEVLKETYPSDTKWDKELNLEKPMYIHITIDAEGLTKESIVEKAKTIQQLLNENGYEYDRVSINANLNDKAFGSYVKYGVGFEGDSSIKEKDVEEYN